MDSSTIHLNYEDDGYDNAGLITSGITVKFTDVGTGTVENDGWGDMDTFQGVDTITGNSLDDNMIGHRGNETFYGGSGDDTLSGADGDDRLHGGAGDDELRGGGWR